MRHLRRGCGLYGLILAMALAPIGCTTTHPLGTLDDPREVARLQALIAQRRVYAVVAEPVRPVAMAPRHPVRSVTREGVQLELQPGRPPVPAGSGVLYLGTSDPLRGARDGAFIVGLPAFFAGTMLAGFYTWATNVCADVCVKRDPAVVGLTVGAVTGIAGAILGAGVGAMIGHEDRYVPRR